MKKKLLVISCTILMVCLTGCTKENNTVDFTEASRKVSFNNIDVITEDLKNIITGADGTIDETNSFVIDQSEVLNGIDIINEYYFNNVIYIQVSNSTNNYMYRFQFKDNQLISYIRYELED